MEKLKIIIIVCYFLTQLCYYNTDAMSATEITNSTLVIEDSQLVIALVFNISLAGSDLNLNGISLSNSVNFDSLCTFKNLSILFNVSSGPFFERNFTISSANSTNIIRVIGDNPDIPCLSDINSTFLQVQPNFLPVFSSQTVYALNVVPDTSPPSFSPFGIIVNLRKGFISIMFSEIIDPSTLDTSLLSIIGSANNLSLSTLVNSNSDTSVNSTYTIRLEVFELPHVSSICGSFSCILRVGSGNIVTDVFGNKLQTQSFNTQAIYINYDPNVFEGSVTIIPHTATQVNFSTTPPAERVEDVIGYQIYMFPLFVNFYDASCDYYPAYEFQNRRNITQWFFENPLNNNFPPCLNTSDYRCIFTNGENVTIDIFPGYAFANIIITIYPQIMFNDSSSFKFANEYYFEVLQFQIFVDLNDPQEGNESTGNETNGPTPIGNRILLRWNVDPSFCDKHQLNINYGGVNTNYSTISLDRLATCVDQYTYIYANSISTVVIPEIRINSSQIHVPEGSCIIVEVNPLSEFSVQIGSFVTERPVVSFIEESFGSNNISLRWITFLPQPGFVIDFYNIYSFPVFALKYNGGSCSNVNSETEKTEFSFMPTEYYIHGVSLSTDFPFTCPPTPGDGLLYDCSSVIRGSDQLFHSFPYDNTYAQGIVVEAVVRQRDTNIIEKIRSFPINFKTFKLFELSMNRFPSFNWNPELCQSDTSFIYFQYAIPSESEPTPEITSVISPCSDNQLVVDNFQGLFFWYRASYISEVTTASGVECLLSYESQVSTFSAGEPSNSPQVVHFEYLDYETILISIFNGVNFSIPANIYTIPFQAQRLQIIGNESDFCPSGSSELPPFTIQTVVNTSISNINNLPCINTNNYLCTTVSNTENIVLKVLPGFDSIIRVELADIEISQFDVVPGQVQIVYSLASSEFAFVTSEINTNVALVSINSIRFDWNVEFYCPPGSFIHLTFSFSSFSGFPGEPGGPGIPDQRRRRDFTNFPDPQNGVTIPCNIGTHTFNDLSFSTSHQFTGQVFFNSTADFFQTCPVIIFLSSETIQTLPLVTERTLLDVSSLQLVWNLIPQVTSYTVLAYPLRTQTIAAPLGEEFFESNTTNFLFIDFQLNAMELFELCLNSSEDLTCSKLTTSDLSATISIIPGYVYNLALSYELMGETIITIIDERYIPSEFLSRLIQVSGFDTILSFRFNDSICSSSSVSTVFYNEFYSVESGFPVNPCMGNEQLINIIDFPIEMIIPRALFIFPFTNIIAPGVNIAPQANIVVFVFPDFSFLPIGASPMVTTVTPPLNSTSDLYQVSWSFPPLDIAQEFDTFVLYAFPNTSNIFTTTNSSCPDIFPGEVEVGSYSSPVYTPLQCPPPVDQFYLCGEYPSMSADIQLFTLLDYDFLVEARFLGGLRAYHSDYLFYTMDKQEISTTLGLAFQVTSQSIVVTWNSQVSYCSNSKFFFSVNSSVNSDAVPCSSANYTIVSLQPLTTYQIEYIILYDLTALQAGTDKCVTNVAQLAFDPLPVTTSLCTPVNPCGSVGVCSEGFLNSSFHCDCNTGYMFDGNTCVDINECNAVPSVCVNAGCLNSVGSFACTCFEGYTPMGASVIVCEDIDECEIADNCVNGICTNLLSPENYRCNCSSDFEGTSCTIPIASPTCPSITETTLLSDNNIIFPVTEYGFVATISCSQLDIELFGSITRFCGDTGDWGTVNIDDCQRIIFVAIELTTTLSLTRTLTPVETVALSDDLATATEVSLFPGEISAASVGVVVIAEALSTLTGDELRESLSSVQENIVVTGSNILRRENSAAFASATPSEAQSYVNNLVDGIQDIGILIGSVAEDNATIVLEISEPTVALIVTVVRDVTEPLVLGSNLSMSLGSNASAVMAAQTSVSIPAAVFQANDDGNGIAVSVALFSTVQELISEVLVNTSEQGANGVRDSLASSLASINLFTRNGQRISLLAEPITIRFVVNTSLIVDNSQQTTQLRCASSRMLSDGWSFLYVDLSNPGDVPPDPANCVATHLTHFGVLVSVTSLDLTEAERLGLQITTYITCSASVLALLFSIVAYVIVWWKTRNNQQSPFNKDATILHLNFAVSLFLALVFFLISDTAYSNEGLCKTVLLFQYYFWLSVFTASLSIGIYLLIKIFAWSSQRRFWYYLVLLTWGLPIPLLIITPVIARDYLINTQEMVCWFSKEPNYANLGFIVPMIVITLTNFVILIITAIVLFRISKGNKGMVPQIRGVLVASFILAPILGLPWLFSIIATAPTSATAFIFTIILGLQGVLFAILYPLRTPEVIDYVIRCKTPRSSTMSKMVSSSVGTASRTPPAALKFRVKRADQSSSVDKSISIVRTNTDTVTASGDFESEDIHINGQSTSSVIIENVYCVPSPEPHYIASIPEDTEADSGKSKSPPPYESLGEEIETFL